MWFKSLTGFDESTRNEVHKNLYVEGNKIVSKINGKSYQYGSLEVPNLLELKNKVSGREIFKDHISVKEVVGDVQEMHCDPANKGALFQAASQFNLLEMIGPHITPEHGIDIYERDYTQGPACAIACGAGTIYRNYFAEINGEIGQTESNQIDCLENIGKILNNELFLLWEMKNGYALLSQEGLLNINKQIHEMSDWERESLKEQLHVGIQWDTEVTLALERHCVTQVYCSALPVAYSQIEFYYWESFARLILEATYEATLYTAMINMEKNNCNKAYLTLVGGGAFGNESNWILDSLKLALLKFRNVPLDIRVVSYGESNSELQEMIATI